MNPGIFVCKHVRDAQRPACRAVHHADGRWQLTCGQVDHPTDQAELFAVHAPHLMERQPELGDALRDLPRGFLAENIDGIWYRVAHDD